jgi:anti-anti-sigma factor
MEIKARIKDHIVILDLCGSIDVNSANLIEAVGQCIRDSHCDILCNYEEVSIIDYMGVSVIAIAYREIVNSNGRMRFANVPSHLRNLFSVTGLDREIEIYASEELAINSFKEDKVIENIKKLQLRRRFKRLPIGIKIELKARHGDNLDYFDVDVFNLSGIGAYVFGCSKFNLGDEVVLKFKAPPKLLGMELEAKVVWLCDKQIQPQLYPGMGVEFFNIHGVVQEKLLNYIEKNLPLMYPEE